MTIFIKYNTIAAQSAHRTQNFLIDEETVLLN